MCTHHSVCIISATTCTYYIINHSRHALHPFFPSLSASSRAPWREIQSWAKHHCPVWLLIPTADQDGLPLCRANIHTGTHCSGKPSCFSWPRTTSPLFLIRLRRMSMSRVTLLSDRSKVQPSRATLSFRMITPFSFRPSRHRERNARRSLSVRYPASGARLVEKETGGQEGGGSERKQS